ncbi:alanyl-tRNA editing protein AlaXM [Acidilobus sp. 7A]|uniref:alanyl-tRNA editing protein AlaXM n=1 Tax=Acidilobus sp. 7A TaxID=1577685 RepID=UPI000764F286|nr:alanyl-tRNA editing protein AlaXM [Acidilobus sp. 7A]AMD30449.1 alanyl-tRNA editing protein AlaX [Acidilobus sp. 7A]
MVRLLYQEDSYIKEFEASVTKIDQNKVYLDATAFHPGPSGGLDADTGVLVLPADAQVKVIDVVEDGDDVAHVLESPAQLKQGDRVRGIIDWDRRYSMMRLHTASHVLAAVLYNKYNAKITGGRIRPDMAQDDFDLSNLENWRSAIADAVKEANEILRKCVEVKVYWLEREKALQIPGIVKLASRLPPAVDRLRVVEIPGVDIQADGAPHVKNTCEVGSIEVINIENRGRTRKRVYYRLSQQVPSF